MAVAYQLDSARRVQAVPGPLQRPQRERVAGVRVQRNVVPRLQPLRLRKVRVAAGGTEREERVAALGRAHAGPTRLDEACTLHNRAGRGVRHGADGRGWVGQ